MKSNFEFLGWYWPALAEIGKTAENYLYTDAKTLMESMYRLGAWLMGLTVPDPMFLGSWIPSLFAKKQSL